MLEFRNASAGYGKRQIIKDVTFGCGKGKITAVIGPNGCGKTTLLRAAAGIIPLSEGEVLLDGSVLSFGKKGHRSADISYLAQGKSIPDITVGAMVLHGRFPLLSYPRKYKEQDKAAALAAMEKMGISDLTRCPVATLSGGMRQKVYIAMALCTDAQVLLFDEPTTYLDISGQLQLARDMKELAAEGKTVVAVLHDIALAFKLSDNIAVMKEGRLEAFGTPEEIIDSEVLPKVFGVRLESVSRRGVTEYFYAQED